MDNLKPASASSFRGSPLGTICLDHMVPLAKNLDFPNKRYYTHLHFSHHTDIVVKKTFTFWIWHFYSLENRPIGKNDSTLLLPNCYNLSIYSSYSRVSKYVHIYISQFRIFFRFLVSRWREVYSFWGIWGPSAEGCKQTDTATGQKQKSSILVLALNLKSSNTNEILGHSPLWS